MGKQISNDDLESICLDTVEDVNIWLWQVAAKGQVLSKTMREQILSRVGNDDIRAYVQHIIPLFNHVVQAVYNNPGSLMQMLSQERSKRRKRNVECNNLIHEAKQKANQTVMEYEKENKGHRKVARRLMNHLRNPSTRLFRAYDLFREEDIEEYLGWFRLWHYRFSITTLAHIERSPQYCNQAPLELLRKLVGQHNEQFTNMPPE